MEPEYKVLMATLQHIEETLLKRPDCKSAVMIIRQERNRFQMEYDHKNSLTQGNA